MRLNIRVSLFKSAALSFYLLKQCCLKAPACVKISDDAKNKVSCVKVSLDN